MFWNTGNIFILANEFVLRTKAVALPSCKASLVPGMRHLSTHTCFKSHPAFVFVDALVALLVVTPASLEEGSG